MRRIPNGIRTRVTAVKGRRPRPLDDGDLVSVDRSAVGDGRTIRPWLSGGPLAPEDAPGAQMGEHGEMVDVPMERFEELVSDALDTLPAELARLMDNVAVFVEDMKPGRPGLLGLYQGVPLTKRGHGYAGHLPDRITIYRLPITRRCSTEEKVVGQVRTTVIHEIAHHFGISDERLHELDAY